MIALKEIEIKKLKETVKQLLNQKQIILIPLQSRYKERVDASKKVYLAKGPKRKYIVILSQEKFDRKELYRHKKLASFYPQIFIDTEIELAEPLYLSIEEFIEGENASNYLLSENIPVKKKKKVFRNIIHFPLFKNKLIGKKISRRSLSSEIQSLISEFSFFFDIELPERKLIESSMKIIVSTLPNFLLIKRLVNFDFIADNIVITAPSEFRVIDLEHQKKSQLGFIEPVRFLKYLCFDLYQKKQHTNGPEVIYRYENPYFLLVSSDTEFAQLRTVLFQTLKMKEALLPHLLLLEFMIDCMIQKNHGNIKRDATSSDYAKHVVSLLTCKDPSERIFVATEYLTKSFVTYDQLLLDKILGSKFYKIWTKYQTVKEKILRG